MISMRGAIRRILGAGATASMVGLSFWNAFGTAEPQKALDQRKAMIDVLPALGPHSSLGDEARVFDRFVAI